MSPTDLYLEKYFYEDRKIMATHEISELRKPNEKLKKRNSKF